MSGNKMNCSERIEKVNQYSHESKIAKRPVAGFAIRSAGITPSALPEGEATNVDPWFMAST
jgi:hypothetical protein